MQEKRSDGLSRFEALASRARAEEGPVVELSAAVLEEIRRRSWDDTRPLVFLTAGSALAAAVFGVLGIAAYGQLQDPVLYLQEWARISGVF